MSVINQPVPSAHPYGHPEAAGSSNLNGIIFASAERSHLTDNHGLGAGIYVSDASQNPHAKGVDLFIYASSSGSGTFSVKVQKFDVASGLWADIPGAAISAATDPFPGVGYIQIYPGVTESTDTDSGTLESIYVSAHLGPTWRVHVTVATAAVTFSIGANYLG